MALIAARGVGRASRGPGAYALGLAVAAGIELSLRAGHADEPKLAALRLSEWHGHAALALLCLALAARPIARYWRWPLRNRRAIGVLAFLFASAHGLYAFQRSLGGSLETLDFLAPATRAGIIAGIAALALLLPLFLTSNDLSLRLLRRNWASLHRLAPLALALAAAHTAWVGAHYGLQPLAASSLALAAALAALLALRHRRTR